MKLIKKRWLSLAIAPALLVLIGFATPANATPYTSCASVPPTVSGDADITDTACVFANDVSASGHISVTATSINATNLTASNGALTLTSSGGPISTAALESVGGATTVTSSGGLISTTTITSVYGAIYVTSSGGDITTTDVSASGGPLNLQSSDKLTVNGTVQTDWDYIDINADSDIDVDQVFSGWKLTMVSTNGKIIADAGSSTADALKAKNYGAMIVKAKTTLDITGVVSSINGDITLESDDDLTTKKVDSGNNLKMTSNNGKITSDGGSTTNDVLIADNYGNVQVKAKTSLTLTGKTTAKKWNVELQANDDVTANEVNAGASMKIVSINGKIDIKDNDLKANTNDGFGNMLLVAKKTIATKNLQTKGTAKTGGIEIQANKGTTPVPFIIGGTGNDNGVNGTIDTTSTYGGGTDPTFIAGGIYVTNGSSGSTGDITINRADAMKVKASASRSGSIVLNAQNGTIAIPSGTALDVSGDTGGAGQVKLAAKTITFATDSIISASQPSGATYHGIFIAAETINFSGDTGLTLNANGDGAGMYAATVSIYPKGSLILSSTSNGSGTEYPYEYLGWYFSVTPQTTTLTFNGPSNSPLSISTNGSDTRINIVGNGTTLYGGDVTLEAKGKTNHSINLYDSLSSDSQGLSFNVTGDVTLDVSGDNGAGSGASGGDIYIGTDILNLNGHDYLLNAAGPSAGNGDGGTIYISSRIAATLSSGTKFSAIADAATSGTGDAQTIQFYTNSEDALFGDEPGQFYLSANGGANGGDGGTVTIAVSHVLLKEATSHDYSIGASALAADGKAGEILSYGTITAVDTNAKVRAKGHGSGDGGKFTSWYYIPTINFNVIKHIEVDGGSSIDPSDFDGSMTINGVTCQQWKLHSEDLFTDTYWNCANPASPQASDEIPVEAARALIANSTTTAALTSSTVRIFVHTNYATHNAFFNDVATAQEPGYTFREPNTAGVPVIVSVQKNCTDCLGHTGPYAFTDKEFKELTMHEVGHAIDYTAGTVIESVGTVYREYQLQDLLNLDYIAVGATQATSTPRPPCSLAGTAPFDGVQANLSPSSAPVSMCVGGAFNTAQLGTPPAGELNSSILQNYSRRIDRRELYAQTFAFVTVADPTNYVDPAADGVFAKTSGGSPTWFSCTLARANQNATGTGTIGAGCSTPVPAWYAALIAF